MKILVCGSRDFRDYELVCQTLNEYLPLSPIIISGGARGADRLAAKFADENNLQLIEYVPDWEKNGKKAGILRNVEMYEATRPDLVVAFWAGKSRGTAHMIDYAERKKCEVRIIF